jgi:hypothetical protein
MATMRFDHTLSGVFLIVHALEAPSAEEWNAHVVAMERGIARISGLMVVSGGAVPNAAQRSMVASMFERQPKHPTVAVMTASTIERNIITAFSWIMRNPIRGFAANRAAEAFDYLDVPRGARSDVLGLAAEWAAELGNPIRLAL